MPFSIHILDHQGESQWTSEIPNGEFILLKAMCKGRAVRNPFTAMLIPIRANSRINFCKDFFAPTLFNLAIKVDGMALRIFIIIVALVLDSLTFPSRLAFAIPRLVFLELQGEQSFHRFLRKEGVEKRFNSDSVRVKLYWEVSKGQKWLEKNVNFVEVPYYEGCWHRYSGYMRNKV